MGELRPERPRRPPPGPGRAETAPARPDAAAPAAAEQAAGVSPGPATTPGPASPGDEGIEPAAPGPPPLALVCPGAPREATDGGDTSDLEGRIDPSRIREVVGANHRDIVGCYERHSLPEPRSGRISVRWVIASDGRVARAEVAQDTIGSPPIERCLVREVCTWRFPAPGRGSVTVTYPFIFDALGF